MDLSKVRVREHYGVVSNNTSTSQFSFLINPPKSRSSLEKNDYLLIDHPLLGEAHQILATITEITSYEEIIGSHINENNKMLATAQVIGGINLTTEKKQITEVLVPPIPGCRVYVPFSDFLQDVLNRNLKGENYKSPFKFGVFIGKALGDSKNDGSIDCLIDADMLSSSHTLVSSVAGAGKTSIAKKIVAAIKDQIKVIVFDFYGEFKEATSSIDLNNGKFEITKESLIDQCKKNGPLSLDGLALSFEAKRKIYQEILKVLLILRIDKKINPLVVIIEEADCLKGQEFEESLALARKVGVSCCLLTNTPSEMGDKLLPLFSTQITGRMTEKKDIDFLSSVSRKVCDLSILPIGDWVLSGVKFNQPTKIHVKL
jgi:DNA helicase HerA-like ATPase